MRLPCPASPCASIARRHRPDDSCGRRAIRLAWLAVMRSCWNASATSGMSCSRLQPGVDVACALAGLLDKRGDVVAGKVEQTSGSLAPLRTDVRLRAASSRLIFSPSEAVNDVHDDGFLNVVESLSVVIYDVDTASMGAVSVANCAHAGSCLALEAGRGQSAENQGSGYGASELDRHRRGACSGRSGERVPCLSSSARKIAEHGQSVCASFTGLLGFSGRAEA